MKFKAILGAAVVLGTMMFASVTAHAATFSASDTTTPTGNNYNVTLSAKGDNASETLNGYIIKVTYDPSKVALVQPDANSDDFAAAGAFCEDGVFVSDVFTENSAQTGTGVVAWANGSAKTIGTADTTLATLSFEKKDTFTSGKAEIGIELTQLSYDGTSLDSATGTKNGSITVGGTVVIYGDVDGDKEVTATDAVLVLRHSNDPTVIANEYLEAADVDADDEITATDAVLILRRSNDPTVEFPAENK